ncbi:hypothetical protein ACFXP3_04535 [Streptomyces sp. NPDC059096]|uniref:hypothetical protein n=1 Tax=Streptomyces sp. NPDC059096 TaxID=3346727 RepID=UPI00368BE7E6
MADDDGPNTPDNLIHFPRVGYTAPTETPAQTPAPAPADVPFAAPADVSTGTSETFAPATRTAPMDTIAALPEPGQGAPFTADPDPSAPAAATPATPGAMVPATFRSEGAQPDGPRLGALSLAAVLAVSLAAMRGIHSAVASGRASREQRETVAKTADAGKDGSSGGGSKKEVQPGHEYGRKMLQRGPGGPSGRSGGAGPGSSGRGGSGPYSGSGSRGRGGPVTRSPSGAGGGSRGGRGGGSGSGSGRTRSEAPGTGIAPLRRNSQGDGRGLSLRKNRGPGSSGGSGGPGGSGGGRGPGSGGGGAGSSGGGSGTVRRRGPGSGSGGWGRKHGPGSSGTDTGRTNGPGTKSPGKGTGGRSTPDASRSKGPGDGFGGKGSGSRGGAGKPPRGTTGPAGILRKKPGTTTSGTGPKTKLQGKDTGAAGPGGAGPVPTGKGGGTKGKTRSRKGRSGPVGPLSKAPDGKSRKGKKLKLTPGITHGTMAASDTYGCRCRRCRRFDREYGKKMDAARKSAARGRTTFGEAVHETAEKRLRRRRKKMGPPVVKKVKVRKPKKTGPKNKATKPSGSTKPAGPAAKAPAGPASMAPARRTPWSTARARARKRARMHARMRTTTLPGPVPTAGPAVPPPPPFPPATPAPTSVAAGAGTHTPAPVPPGGTVPGTGEPRLSPFEAMGMATATAVPAEPITVERADAPPAGPAPSGGGLPVTPPSTKENSVNTWLTKWGDVDSVAEMDAQHETEVTLDDSLDVLEELTTQSFGAHETCRKLAAKAREIRHELDELAADLRSTHNILGRLTGAAMAKLAESMELLARKADEMSQKSLLAAELCESTEHAMFDAYRPLQQATEDAGLTVPAARVHNEN